MTRRDPAIEALIQATRPDAVGDRYAADRRGQSPLTDHAPMPWRVGRVVSGTNYGMAGVYSPNDANPTGYWFEEVDRQGLATFVGSATTPRVGEVNVQHAEPVTGSRSGAFVKLPMGSYFEFIRTGPGAYAMMRVLIDVFGDDQHVEVCQATGQIVHLLPFNEAFTLDICLHRYVEFDKVGHARRWRADSLPENWYGPSA